MGGLIVAGAIETRTLADDPGLTYSLYVPARGGTGAPVFVSVHGRSRRADQHAALFAPFAERRGAVLVAPLFARDRFPDYHCLGRDGRGERSDLILDRIVAEVRAGTGARDGPIYLFGYSGGGQFAHRYAMAHPARVVRAALGAAGWYTFPDPGLDYPLGIRSAAGLRGLSFDPDAFLTVPCLVLVGEHDTLREELLNKDPQVDAQQGLHRVERAWRWVEAMRAAATARGLVPRCEFHLLPGAGHSFAECMTRTDMGERVLRHLFGDGET